MLKVYFKRIHALVAENFSLCNWQGFFSLFDLVYEMSTGSRFPLLADNKKNEKLFKSNE